MRIAHLCKEKQGKYRYFYWHILVAGWQYGVDAGMSDLPRRVSGRDKDDLPVMKRSEMMLSPLRPLNHHRLKPPSGTKDAPQGHFRLSIWPVLRDRWRRWQSILSGCQAGRGAALR